MVYEGVGYWEADSGKGDSMRSRPAYLLHTAFVVLLLVVAGSASAVTMINNGFSPPNGANVIDDGTYSGDFVYVRNVGCPPAWPSGGADDPCSLPGDPTEVALVQGGYVERMHAQDSSTIEMSGGAVDFTMNAHDSSTVTVTGGAIYHDLLGFESSTITMSGGSVGEELTGNASSTITLSGGSVGTYLYALDFSTVIMSGGTVLGKVHAANSSTVTMSGGWVNTSLEAKESSTITIVGHDFLALGLVGIAISGRRRRL